MTEILSNDLERRCSVGSTGVELDVALHKTEP